VVAAVAAAPAAAATVSLESVATTGVQGNLYSYAVGLSAQARFVLFSSDATNLVPGDTNERSDVFLRDRLAGRTIRVSVSSSGAQAAAGADPFGGSHAGGISADGRFAVFRSDAANLVPGDTNGVADVFVRDLATGRTQRVSVSGAGGQANGVSGEPAISADGRYVAFASAASNLVHHDTNGVADVFVRDRIAGTTSRVSVSSGRRQGDAESESPSISSHGRYVAFTSPASTLVGHDTNGLADVFVRDRRTRTTRRISVSSRGHQAAGSATGTGSNAPALSGDGRFVAFHSDASNLVPHDTNRAFDIFVRDTVAGVTRRVSVGPRGRQANAESLGPPVISADGRFVAFGSLASNLVAHDTNDVTDVFVRDRVRHVTILASTARDGAQGNDGAVPAALTPAGRYLLFTSWAGNLVPGDASPGPDVFLRDFGRRRRG
jgi:Tol biopolymer transport system component